MVSLESRPLVRVKVPASLREYILSINSGSDIILPARDSRLWGLVRMHLDTIPSDYQPMPKDGYEDSIRIALYRCKRKTYSFPANRSLTLHTMYRDYIPPVGQQAIARHLMQGFKQTYHAYMTGAMSNNPDLDIIEAIDEFLSDYHIEPDKITIEMLRKDWYRHRMRCMSDDPKMVDTIDL